MTGPDRTGVRHRSAVPAPSGVAAVSAGKPCASSAAPAGAGVDLDADIQNRAAMVVNTWLVFDTFGLVCCGECPTFLFLSFFLL